MHKIRDLFVNHGNLALKIIYPGKSIPAVVKYIQERKTIFADVRKIFARTSGRTFSSTPDPPNFTTGVFNRHDVERCIIVFPGKLIRLPVTRFLVFDDNQHHRKLHSRRARRGGPARPGPKPTETGRTPRARISVQTKRPAN